ncbi:MAG: type 1 glutamine amidotransferase [Candidatus Omnitrophica bacterium]|nr:type 1 glutamine amidotransferase [Candidatus Omnitrophota bacterium]
MTLHGMRVAILVEDLYQDQEVWYPYYRLKEAGAEAVFIGTGKPEYRSKFGYPLTPDAQAERVSAAEFDAIIIPGGYAPDLLRRFPAVIQLAREANRQGKLIGAICHAGWVLCSADVLRGKTATCFSAIKDDVVNAGATYVDREVVRDGHLITARKPDDLPAFMRTMIEALQESQVHQKQERSGDASRRRAPTAARPARR